MSNIDKEFKVLSEKIDFLVKKRLELAEVLHAIAAKIITEISEKIEKCEEKIVQCEKRIEEIHLLQNISQEDPLPIILGAKNNLLSKKKENYSFLEYAPASAGSRDIQKLG